MTPPTIPAQQVDPAELNPAPARPHKAIPPARDRLQSRLLVWTVMPILCVLGFFFAFLDFPHISNAHLASIAISLAFALVAWRLKAATPAAAACGGIICLLLTSPFVQSGQLLQSGLPPLIALFVLTHVATRAGRRRKAMAGLAESRKGRTLSQVIANLGAAVPLAFPLGIIVVNAIWPMPDYQDTSWVIAVLVLSALAEATADTVSSEIGQAFGGRPILLTTLRRVEPGTDGAISLRGTLTGVLAAAIVAASGARSMHLSPMQSSIALTGGICGLFFDSLLGATLERRGWIGNDLVNFCSTVSSPALCLVVLRLIPSLGPHPFVMYFSPR
jgi:uncharacterized protein (TIGR00297 family)